MVNVLGEAALFPKLEPEKDISAEPVTCCGILFTWPKSTLLVYLNETGERFAFYGIKAILTTYLLKAVGFDPQTAMIVFHAFLALCYMTPLLGGYLADGVFGRFWTILWFSVVYLTGLLILTISSTFPLGYPLHPWLDFFALFIVAFGCGCIKPNLAVLGADQLPAHHLSMISIFFALYYVFVNVGGVLGTILVPSALLAPCMGQSACFPMAFGLALAAMAVTTALFCFGACLYKPVQPIPGIFGKVINTVKIALYVKFKGIGASREHWLDYYLNIHDCAKHLDCIQASKQRAPGSPPNCPQAKFVEDVKVFFRLQKMLLPVVLFWALYEQQSSRWLIQSAQFNGQLSPTFFLLPQHMPIFQGVLHILLIPLFQFFIYPLLASCGIRLTYLKRMIVGGLFAVMAFVLAGIIQMGLSQTLPAIPGSGQASLHVVNSFAPGCRIVVGDVPGYVTPAVIPAGMSLTDNPLAARQEEYMVQVGSGTRVTPGIQMNGSCAGRGFVRYAVELRGGESKYIVVSPQGVFSNDAHFDKPVQGLASSYVSVNMLVPCKFLPDALKSVASCAGLPANLAALTPYSGALALCRKDPSGVPCNPMDPTGYFEWAAPTSEGPLKAFPPKGDNPQGRARFSHYANGIVSPGTYAAHYVLSGPTPTAPAQYVPVDGSDFGVQGMGGVYVLTVSLGDSVLVDDAVQNVQAFHQVSPNNYMSIVWQIPQYVLMAVAEIMFVITGLEFVYAQVIGGLVVESLFQSAPPLKAFLMAFWMFYIGLGDLLVMIVAVLNPFADLTNEFFAYAGALLLVVGLFAYLSMYYPYANYTGIEPEEAGLLDASVDLGVDNEGFVSTMVTRL